MTKEIYLENAKKEVTEILLNMKESTRSVFLDWIKFTWIEPQNDERVLLQEIAEELRSRVPMSGVLPAEQIFEHTRRKKIPPLVEENSVETVEIDEFLYDDESLHEMAKEGKVCLQYCSACGGRDIRPLNLISHSCSVERLTYLFKALLPPLVNKTFLDIGSRLGAVLYGAYFLSKCSKIIGVEINEEFCRIAQSVIEKRAMRDRIEIIHADISSKPELITEADVVMVSNAFQYFVDSALGLSCWRMIYERIKPGTLLVLTPSADDTFEMYNIGVYWRDWLEKLPIHNLDAMGLVDSSCCNTIFAYRVKETKLTVSSCEG